MTDLSPTTAPPEPNGDALARDTTLLETLLGEVLTEQRGPAFAAAVGELHALARALREERQDVLGELLARLRGLDDDALTASIHALTMQLQLANIAEETERVRRRREYDASGLTQRESPAEAAALLRVAGQDVSTALEGIHVELVLTAHPTEATRRSVLDHQRAVARLMDALGDPRLGPTRRRALRDELREILTVWWQTDEVRRLRPRVEDEVRRGLFAFEATLYDAVPDLLDELERAFDAPAASRTLTFGSWAGADMDGHPEVGAETLARTLALHRETALRLLGDRVAALAARFSHSSRAVTVSPALLASLEEDAVQLPGAAVLRRPHRTFEPLRSKLGFVERRLANTLGGDGAGREGTYAGPDELRADLELVRDCLGSAHVAHGAIRRLLRQVDLFGFHLASLDVRQGADVVQEAVAALLPGYDGAAEPERQALLGLALGEDRHGLEHVPEGTAGEFLRVLDTMALAGRAYGPRGVPVIVLSMSRRPSDVLAALWLTRRAGLRDERAVRIVPLFETLADLDASEATMAALYADPAYRAHLDGLGGRQTVMIGYSDSGKDSGAVASQWGLYRAQERLAAQAAAAGVELELFHGRGGSPSRGGGRAHQAILAQPRGALAGGRIRITEQGETISERYSDPELAQRSLEQTVSAVVLAAHLPPAPIEERWRTAMDALAERSRAHYRGLVYEDPDFNRFCVQITPLAELADLNIGSRPPKRGGDAGVESLRAIPWVFAWTQNRILLTSWFGAGTALAAGDLELQREMLARWPFFRGLVSTLEMALFKTDLGVAEQYLRLVDEDLRERCWAIVASEYERVVDRVLAITGSTRLLDGSPALQRRLDHRNPWVDPLSHLQVELLARVRAGRDARDPLLASIAGIASGLRNTG